MNTSIGCRALSNKETELLISKLTTKRDELLFTLGLNTGFRITELLSIEVSSLYDSLGTLKPSLLVSKSKMKGKHSSRAVPLSTKLLETLKTFLMGLPEGQKYLFESQKGTKLSRVQAWRIIKTAALRANLSGKIGTHSARKSLAMNAYEASGHDLVVTQRILGHKSVNSTISYLAIEPENLALVWKKVQS